MGELIVTSKSSAHGGMIPTRYSEKGEELSPPITIRGVGPAAKAIAVIAEIKALAEHARQIAAQ